MLSDSDVKRYLGVEGAAAAAAWGEEVDDHEPVAGAEQGVREVLRGLDLAHVGVQPLLPPPHGLGERQVHLQCSSQKKEIPRLSKQERERESEKIMSAKLFSWRELNLKQKMGESCK